LWGWGSVTSTVAGAYRLTNGLPTGAKQTITSTGVTNNQYVAKFITAVDQRFSRISQGEVIVSFSANKGAAGAASVRPEFYLLDANGATITEYETGQASALLTTAETPYSLAVPIPSNITVSATNRIGVYLKAVVSSGTPTINAWYLGDPTTGTEPVEWGHFVNCLGDSTSGPAWLVRQGTASRLGNMVFDGCWAGNGQYGAYFDGLTNTAVTGWKTGGNSRDGILLVSCAGIVDAYLKSIGA